MNITNLKAQAQTDDKKVELDTTLDEINMTKANLHWLLTSTLQVFTT